MYLYCKTDRRENPIFCHPQSPNGELNAGQKIDWNDSGGQRPAIIEVKSKKQKGKRIHIIRH